MAQHRRVHVVFGAGGGAGHAVVRNLAVAGEKVCAVTHSGAAVYRDGVENIRCDASNIDAVRAACEGAAVVQHQPLHSKKWKASL